MQLDQPVVPTRRQAAAAASVAAAAALSACTAGTSSADATATGRTTASRPSGAGKATAPSPVPRPPGTPVPLVKVADAPVGTAVSAKGPGGRPVILVRTSEDTAVGFSAICTHAGCTVAPDTGLRLRCPCHGSTFDAATGKRTGGPAPAGLIRIPVKIAGGSIVAV